MSYNKTIWKSKDIITREKMQKIEDQLEVLSEQETSGTSDYLELENKPQINGVALTGNKSLTDLGVAATSDVAEKYTKPGTGIPASDLSSTVQASLQKADTALQGENLTSAVNNYLETNFSNPSSPPLDRTLSSSASAAPADMVGELKSAIDEIAYKPWTKTEVGLLDQIGSKIAFTSADGGTLWDQLIASLRSNLPIEYFDVTWSGADHVTGTMPTQAAENSQFSVTLSPSFGYEITSLSAVMGEDTYTGTAGAGGAYTLTIASVTDDVTVTVATQSVTVETIYSAQNLTFDGSSESQIIDTGLVFDSTSTANSYTEDWTLMCKAHSTATGFDWYGVVFQTIDGKILRFHDTNYARINVLSQNVTTEDWLRNATVGVVITHHANVADKLTVHSVVNGEVVETEVTASNIDYYINHSNSCELQLGGKTTKGYFIGTIEDITIYKAIVDDATIEDYLLGGV